MSIESRHAPHLKLLDYADPVSTFSHDFTLRCRSLRTRATHSKLDRTPVQTIKSQYPRKKYSTSSRNSLNSITYLTSSY